MKESLFKQLGGTYHQEGDFLIPDLMLSEEEGKPICVWGQRRKRYLKEHRKEVYAELLTSGKLNGHLAEIDAQAQEMFSRLVKRIAAEEGITEQLKAENQMEWVGKMNNVKERTRDVVNAEFLFA